MFESWKRIIKRGLVLITTVFTLVLCVSAQSKKEAPMRLLLTTPETTFSAGKSAKVQIVFENLTKKNIPSVDYLSIVLHLERTTSDENRRGWDDTYYAFFSVREKINLPNKGRYETEIDLSDLYWLDGQSSFNHDKSEPKNFYQAIASGGFYLRAVLIQDLSLWKKNDPRFKKRVESNKCMVTVESERQYRKWASD